MPELSETTRPAPEARQETIAALCESFARGPCHGPLPRGDRARDAKYRLKAEHKAQKLLERGGK